MAYSMTTRAARQFVTVLLIAAYSGIAILGHGLHWLAAESGHHHGHEIVHCSIHGADRHHYSHSHDCHDHHEHSGHCGSHEAPADDSKRDDPLSLSAGGCIPLSHECEICAFLALISKGRPNGSAFVPGQRLIGATAFPEHPAYSSSHLNWHAPRGPPALG
jgi:hypothetical protein